MRFDNELQSRGDVCHEDEDDLARSIAVPSGQFNLWRNMSTCSCSPNGRMLMVYAFCIHRRSPEFVYLPGSLN